VIIPDINLLLYAVITGFADHVRARSWWEAALSGTEPIGLASPVLFGFLRISTSGRVVQDPLSIDESLGYLREWLARPVVSMLPTTEDHVTVAFDLIRQVGVASNLTTDAQIAAHALSQGATVYSNDSDFARFPRVDWVNPLRD
jgi:toxin-antitoxin system PIN domain toxin